MILAHIYKDTRRKMYKSRKSPKGVQAKMQQADVELRKLREIGPVENPSLLVKYRQNITVPVQWVPVQGIRAENIGMIPAENIVDLDRYITDSVKRIDGGDLDA